MYPAFIQLETRLRLADKRLEDRDSRSGADGARPTGTPHHSSPYPEDARALPEMR
jgi:hypothetical protein